MCGPMDAELTETMHVKGLLRMITSQCPEHARVFPYDPLTINESHSLLQNRRRRRKLNQTLGSEEIPLLQLANRHRYICFFVVQNYSSNLYSNHCLMLRKRLAEDYHDVMTTLLITVGNTTGTRTTSHDDDIFCQGTGFASIPASSLLLSMLNITHVPTILILETSSGQKISRDAMLAMEWNDPHHVINAWQKGNSGLTFAQKVLAIATLQSEEHCIIL